MTTALESYRRNEESGISSTNLATTEVNVTDIEDKPCQLAKPHVYVADYERTHYIPACHLIQC
jgi:hypothetical protein